MLVIPTATAPGSRTLSELSTGFELPSYPTQQRLQLDEGDAENARKYIVLEGETERSLAHSAVQEEPIPHREAMLEGDRTAKYLDDLVESELSLVLWNGTEGLPVELQWPGYSARPSTFFIIDSSCTRAELTAKIAQWVLIQIEELRQASPGSVPAWSLKNLGRYHVHLIGLYGIEEESEISKYVVDLSMDLQPKP